MRRLKTTADRFSAEMKKAIEEEVARKAKKRKSQKRKRQSK